MNRLKNLGLYIHIPFCLSKCRYCDFCSFPHPKRETVEKYLLALYREIEEYSGNYGEYNVNTVYFGGGTPTLLEADLLCGLLKKLKKHFAVSDSAEITAECNPKTADLEYFKKIRSAGFNRLSIGVQSMDEGELKMLGRLHSPDDAKKAFADARAAGFDNLSADLMFALPSQKPETLMASLKSICDLEPDHISLYGLKIEEDTYFGRHRGELELPDEDAEYEMYLACVTELAKRGYHRYEISNFAKDGKYSRHNLKYWKREDYLGLGAAAHSCIGDNRFANTCDIAKYCDRERVESFETISEHDILCEKIMLGMRLSDGCDFDILKAEHGESADAYRDALECYVRHGFVIKDGARLAFSNKGTYISNYILSEILDFER